MILTPPPLPPASPPLLLFGKYKSKTEELLRRKIILIPKSISTTLGSKTKTGRVEFVMGSQSHVLVVSFPAQGHVAPRMKLSHQIADHGIKVTFVSTEFIIARLTTKMPMNSLIRLVSLPDGLEPEDD
ncbi:hypothetical protein SO802_020874 [Lithocarpus litseifolius]|uniref:Glycosyltransferase N-terminal domain-containing protein n=1 Tax=Lithocarpus litseifolius TaxID=425828 RepID=A0AAW2CDT0_9ROSI